MALYNALNPPPSGSLNGGWLDEVTVTAKKPAAPSGNTPLDYLNSVLTTGPAWIRALTGEPLYTPSAGSAGAPEERKGTNTLFWILGGIVLLVILLMLFAGRKKGK